MKFNHKILKSFVILYASFVCIFISSCASTKNAVGANLDSKNEFTKKQLSNGIPVIFRQKYGSKIVVFKMIFDGGSSVIKEELGGIENLTLDLIMRGSQNYPYSMIQKLEYEKSIYLSSGAGRDYSVAGFTCIQRDLDLSIDLFSDCVLSPAFLEADFTKKMTEIESSIARKKADPSGALGLALSKEVFKNHPYSTSSSVTEETFKNINLELVKENHQKLLNADRMKIVIVGNFSDDLIEDFVSSLDKKFGAVQKKSFSLPKIPDLKVDAGVELIANEQAGETGYIAGVFEYPNRDSSDCIPLAISLMYLDDLLFSQVREKAGAVYSINTDVIGGKKLLGVLSVYKATEKEKLKKLICDTILSFDAETLEKKLDQYKNRYISSLFSSSQSSAGLASSVIFSMEYFGSETASLKRTELVQKVTAKQVVSAYKKYVEPVAKENRARWFIVDGKENLKKYDF